jgi:polyisoprenoid-binding protein YceI
MEQATTTTWAIDPVHTKIRFEAKYLMITAVSGWFREFEGLVVSNTEDFSDSEITITIYTNSLFTGNEERDNHLRSPDFFDTKKYPTITFRSTATTVHAENCITVTGQLAIKDTVQEISFGAKYLGSVPDPMGNTKACFEMDAVFDRKVFNITWNQFFDQQGVLISDQVKLHADVQLLRMP